MRVRQTEYLERLTEFLPSFMASPSSDDVVEWDKLGAECAAASRTGGAHLLWDQYKVSVDAAGWLYTIVGAVETMPVAVSIADMRVAGAPLIYVNQAWCALTGYAKPEAQGSNCRFLQGPETEVASVAAIVEALRTGADCTLRLTNYKRSGKPFANLLSLRPVHDSNGVYRFVLGVQADASSGEATIELIVALLHLLPSRIKLALNAQPCGPFHQRPEPPANPPDIDAIVRSALAGAVGAPAAVDVRGSTRWTSNHKDMTTSIAESPDRLPLLALLWMSPALLPQLEAAFAHESVSSLFGTRIQLDPAMLRNLRDADGPARARAIARELAKDVGSFVESAEGKALVHMAEVHGAGHGVIPSLTQGQSWLGMLAEATARLPFAVIVADMHEPTAKLVCVNEAFAALTGHAVADAVGRNCRFLQGPETEKDAVQRLVEGMRAAQPVQVELTNYRKDGTTFRNLLSLQPVHDSEGRYRYCTGVLTDAKALKGAARDDLARLCRMLPRRFELALQPLAKPREGPGGRRLARRSSAVLSQDYLTTGGKDQFQARGIALAKLLWLEDPTLSLNVLLSHNTGLPVFEQHLVTNRGPNAKEFKQQLALVLAVRKMGALPVPMQIAESHKIAIEHLGTTPAPEDGAAVMAELNRRAESCVRALASLCLPSFLRSAASDAVVSAVQLGSERGFAGSSHLLWEQYKVSVDAAGWLYSVVGTVETMPVAVSIADMCVPGAPLIYVNQAFCALTGYSKSEAQGCNCRFLQGPETEVSGVAKMVDAIRAGADCTLRLNNYKRTGEAFGNLLSLRPVHDSNGVYRFVLGVQADVTATRATLELIKSYVELLPTELEVGDVPACGPVAVTKERPRPPPVVLVDILNPLANRFSLAVDLPTPGGAHFSGHHTTMLQSLGLYDCSRPFTRLAWLANLSPIFNALMLHDFFRRVLEQHVAATARELVEQSRLVIAVADLPLLQREPVKLMERAQELYTLIVQRSVRGKSLHVIQKELEDVCLPMRRKLCSVVFPGLIESTRCLRVLEQVLLLETDDPDEEIEMVAPGSWVGMLAEGTAQLPFAVVAADMHTPGANLVCVNEAFTALTGVEADEAIGQNCRFLQGPETERDAVQRLVEGMRAAQPVQVELTNYRKDGSAFRNLLSLQPVHDSEGRYRYCIGVLADAQALDPAARDEYERLCRMLPRRFELSLQPLPSLNASGIAGGVAPDGDLADELLGKLAALQEPEATMSGLLEKKASLVSFRDHLLELDADDASAMVDFYVDSISFLKLSGSEQRDRVYDVFSK